MGIFKKVELFNPALISSGNIIIYATEINFKKVRIRFSITGGQLNERCRK